MKKQSIIILTLAAAISSAFTLAMVWKADEKASTVNWELPNNPGHKGTFGNLSSTIDFDKAKLAGSKITASIDVKTINGGDPKLNAHLLTADFFDAEKFPKITFTSTEIKTNGDAYIAKGTLTMKDSTKVIELPFTFKEDGSNKATFSGTMTINASDYGVMKKSKDPAKAGNDKTIINLVVPVSK
ncbi:MAG TPA: YceI family protein [Bacteroidia bacterium]|jgi:polyisoprenoid-binding protein YceI|nr:YceI family protein [Bacteroidia bacterium]